jgi:hypothetical protein
VIRSARRSAETLGAVLHRRHLRRLEMLALAREAGFRKVQHVSGATLTQRHFTDRTDDPRPSSVEDMLVTTTQGRSSRDPPYG